MVQLLQPAEKSIHTKDSVAFVTRMDPNSFETIKIFSNRNKTVVIKPKAGLDTYCRNISLHPGSNRVYVRVYAGGKMVAEIVRNIYYTAPLSKEERYPPQGYEHTYFHTESEEALCTSCHDMRVNEKPNIAFVDVSRSNCYLCHRNMNAKEQGHSPSVNWLCTSCHSGSGREMNTTAPSRFLTPKPAVQSCLNCHEMKKRLWKEKTFTHFPVETGKCDYCHNPHASDHRFMLHKEGWELCRSCHGDKPGKAAYLRKLRSLGEDPENIAGDGQELRCTSCHDPHVSDRALFLKPEYSGESSVCQW